MSHYIIYIGRFQQGCRALTLQFGHEYRSIALSSCCLSCLRHDLPAPGRRPWYDPTCAAGVSAGERKPFADCSVWHCERAVQRIPQSIDDQEPDNRGRPRLGIATEPTLAKSQAISVSARRNSNESQANSQVVNQVAPALLCNDVNIRLGETRSHRGSGIHINTRL